MKRNKMYIVIIVIGVLLVLLGLSFAPLWPKEVKSGWIRVNTWEKIQLMRGKVFMD